MEIVLKERPLVKLIEGDCLDVLKSFADNSVDSIVTDPPAGIGFLGKEWDTFDRRYFGRAGDEGDSDLKVKKGFNILPRYQNYIRDNFISWLSKVASECIRVLKPGGHALVWAIPRTSHWTATAWEEAGFEVRDRIVHCFGSGFPKSLNIGKAIKRLVDSDCGWGGWGSGLKPAVEDWWLFRKPLERGLSIAENVLKWGVGGLNIDGCRPESGRYPANLIHDGSDEVISLFPKGASRFFYCAKASRRERDMGLDDEEEVAGGVYRLKLTGSGKPRRVRVKNDHPTVKPVKLLMYLVKLITPLGGVVLDPFMGSGSTGIACIRLGCGFIGIEKDGHYFDIAVKRIKHVLCETFF